MTYFADVCVLVDIDNCMEDGIIVTGVDVGHNEVCVVGDDENDVLSSFDFQQLNLFHH